MGTISKGAYKNTRGYNTCPSRNGQWGGLGNITMAAQVWKGTHQVARSHLS